MASSLQPMQPSLPHLTPSHFLYLTIPSGRVTSKMFVEAKWFEVKWLADYKFFATVKAYLELGLLFQVALQQLLP